MSSKNIRVYELAKQLNKTSKEVMAVLAEKNIEVTTHMATLEDNQAAMVRAKLGGTKPAKQEKADKPEQDKTALPSQAQEPKAAPKKKKFIVVHNPENSRDKKSPERRTPARKPQTDRPVQRRDAGTKTEGKLAAKPARIAKMA